jgi:protease PrsW
MSQPYYAPAGQPQAAFPSPVPAGAPAPTRWETQTSFWQTRQPAFWLFIVTVAITGLVMLVKQAEMIQAAPGAWLTTLLLLAPYVIPVGIFIYLIDMYEPEPKTILFAAIAWGGFAATTLALYTNTPLAELLFKFTNPEFAGAWGAALTAPFVEEGFKALGIILLVSIARPELDDILDGFIWGAMVGIGFLVVEDVFYFMNAFVQAQGDFTSLWQMFLIRVIGAGPYSHFLYTGLTGMGIAYFVTRQDQPRQRRLLFGIGLAALGVGAHFIWNSPILSGIADQGTLESFLLYVTIKGLPLLIGLIVVVRLARARDQRWFGHLAANPLVAEDISAADVNELGGLVRRWRARRASGRERGSAGKRMRGAIQRQEIALAVAAGHAAGQDDPALVASRQGLRELRARYDALPARAVAAQAAQAGAWQGAASASPATNVMPSAPPVSAAGWSPTNRVPPDGMPAWPSPDPSQASVPLGGGLPVMVAERRGDWARVVASNGWTGWVDGRRLG